MRVNVPSHNTYVTFPDGTPMDVIDKILHENFGVKKEMLVDEDIAMIVKTLSDEELKIIIRGE